jgi:hypothetical protein
MVVWAAGVVVYYGVSLSGLFYIVYIVSLFHCDVLADGKSSFNCVILFLE